MSGKDEVGQNKIGVILRLGGSEVSILAKRNGR